MAPADDASWTQNFSIGANAFLESNPEWLILQGQSSFTQRTSLSVEKSGELLFIEAIAPGRIAHGETFAFRRFRNRLSLRYDGELALLEKHRIEPEQGSACSWTNELGETCPLYVSILLVSERLETASPFWAYIHGLHNAELKIGSSQLAHGPCWNVKILAKNPIAARKAIANLRERFYAEIKRSPQGDRKPARTLLRRNQAKPDRPETPVGGG